MTPYTEVLKQLQPKYDPRHIEAYIRIQYGTLDHLDTRTMKREAKIAAQCVDVGGIEAAERLAQSIV